MFSKEYTDCSDKTEFVYCLQFYRRTGDLKPRHLAWVNGERIQISLLEVFDWHGSRKYYTYLVNLHIYTNHDVRLVNSDGPQFSIRAKKLGKYCFRYQKNRRDRILLVIWLSLPFQAWIQSRYVPEIRDRFIGRLRTWFIFNQSKVLYYWGGSSCLKGCQHERRGENSVRQFLCPL